MLGESNSKKERRKGEKMWSKCVFCPLSLSLSLLPMCNAHYKRKKLSLFPPPVRLEEAGSQSSSFHSRDESKSTRISSHTRRKTRREVMRFPIHLCREGKGNKTTTGNRCKEKNKWNVTEGCKKAWGKYCRSFVQSESRRFFQCDVRVDFNIVFLSE